MLFKDRPNFPSGLKVLLIDGEQGARQRVSEQLTALSFVVAPCANAEAACTALTTPGASYDIILAEVSCLGASGSDRVLTVAKGEGMPLVLMSSTSGPDEVMKGIELGAVDFLETPVSQLKLRNIWQHVVRKMMCAEPGRERSAKEENSQEMVASGSNSPRAITPTLSAAAPQSELTSLSSKCCETDASSYVEVKDEVMAESSGVAGMGLPHVAPLGLTGSFSLNLSHKGSCKAGGIPTVASQTSCLPPQGAPSLSLPHSSAQDLRCSGSRTSKRLKAESVSAGTLRQASSMPISLAAARQAARVAPGLMQAPPMVVPLAGATQPVGPYCVWGTPVSGQQLPAPGYVGPPSTFGQWQAPASMMVPVSETTLRSAVPCAGGADGSPVAVDLNRLSLESSVTALSGSRGGIDWRVAHGSDFLEDREASFSVSGDSMHSALSELLLPDDLELDLMFGDSLAAMPQPMVQRPPIGLALRKSESLVNLINSHLSRTSPGTTGAC